MHLDHVAVGAEPVLVAAHFCVEASETFHHRRMRRQPRTHAFEKFHSHPIEMQAGKKKRLA